MEQIVTIIQTIGRRKKTFEENYLWIIKIFCIVTFIFMINMTFNYVTISQGANSEDFSTILFVCFSMICFYTSGLRLRGGVRGGASAYLND